MALVLAAVPAIVLPPGCAGHGSDGSSTSAGSTSTAPATQPQRPDSGVAGSGTGSREEPAPASEQSAGEPGGQTITSSRGRYVITFNPGTQEIPLNELFTLRVDVVDAERGGPVDEDVQLSVDAAMPAHRHGMNTRPVVERTGAGSFLVDGMLFHMAGEWELYFDLTRNGVTERALETVVLD